MSCPTFRSMNLITNVSQQHRTWDCLCRLWKILSTGAGAREYWFPVKNIIFLAAFLAAVLVSPASSFAQSDAVLSSPTRSQLESAVGKMDLSMGQKLSLRSVLQALRESGEKVLGNSSLSNAQKAAQIVQLRQGTLGQTQKILSAPQQQQLSALLLPKQ
jgi:hypothetical protein